MHHFLYGSRGHKDYEALKNSLRHVPETMRKNLKISTNFKDGGRDEIRTKISGTKMQQFFFNVFFSLPSRSTFPKGPLNPRT